MSSLSPLRIKNTVYWTDCQQQRVVLDLEQGKYYALAGTAREIWELIAGGSQPQAIAETIAQKYSMTLASAKAEVETFITYLTCSQLLEVIHPSSYSEYAASATKSRLHAARSGPARSNPPGRIRSSIYIFQSYIMLVSIDFALKLFGFHHIINLLRQVFPDSEGTIPNPEFVENLARAPLAAFKWYRPGVACLHRALLTFCFLRAKGIAADLCIGITTFPFSSHSWAEFQGVALNDFQSVKNKYAVIARFP